MLFYKTSLPVVIRTVIQSLFTLSVAFITQLYLGFCSFHRKQTQLHHFRLTSHTLHGFSENELQKTLTEDTHRWPWKTNRNDKEQNYVGCATVRVASHWLLNREARVNLRPVPARFVINKVTMGHTFLQVLQYSLVSTIHQCSIVTHITDTI